MPTVTRRFAAASAAAAVLTAGVVVAAPGLTTAVGLDVWNVPALRAEVRAEAVRCQALETEDDDIRRRIEVKEALVADLIAGRVTLAVVTDRFIDLNRDRPEHVAAVRATYPGDTDEEKTARNVIEYAAGRLSGEPPARRAAVLARLEAEHRDLGSPHPGGTR